MIFNLRQRAGLCALLGMSFLAIGAGPLSAQTKLNVTANSIGGKVTGANGPEAGVWVIAETTDLPTRYAKIVVTDDNGQYMLPELPAVLKSWETKPADDANFG